MSQDHVEIQLFDVDVRDRLKKPDDAVIRDENQKAPYKPNRSTVHILGKTKEGHAVYVKVKKFRPWLFFGGIPPQYAGNAKRTITKILTEIYNLEDENDLNPDKHPEYHIEFRSFVNGWIGDATTGGKTIQKFLWFRLTYPSQSARSYGARMLRKHSQFHVCQETDDVSTQFFTLTDTQNNGWVTVRPRRVYRTQTKTYACAMELMCLPEDIEPIKDKIDLAPLRLLSWDIETYSVDGTFPEPSEPENYILNIGNIMVNMNSYTGDDQEYGIVFCLKKTPDIQQEKVTILSYDTEEELLYAWWYWVVHQYDPDVMISYNGRDFDWNFVFERSKLYPRVFSSLTQWSRLRKDQCTLENCDFNSKQRGEMKSRRWEVKNYYRKPIFGRFDMDLLIYMCTEYKLRSYSLNFVSAKYLNDKKVDLPYTKLWTNFHSEEGRRENAEYCVYDCRLPVRLVLKLQALLTRISISRLTFTSLEDLQSRGQSARVMNQINYYAYYENFVVNKLDDCNDEGYEGATVIDPIKGFFQDPVTTLDFKSLYPSLMQAFNTCYSTLVRDLDQLNLPNIEYEEHPIRTKSGEIRTHYFVKHFEGLLPKILSILLNSRAAVKKQMGAETDPFRKAVLNGRQLALKISCNSVYGFTGCAFGRLPCLAISETVTYRGRSLIEQTKQLVETNYDARTIYGDNIPPDLPFHNSQVIYGDTDSVMIRFPVTPDMEGVKRSFEWGEHAAAFVTSKLPKPVELEFEKVYWPYLLIAKKRYVGLMYTSLKHEPTIDKKGLENVRRDTLLFTSKLLDELQDALIRKRDPELAREILDNRMREFIDGRVDFDQFILSKSLKSDYSKPHSVEQWVVMNKIRERDPGSEPKPGSRVPYVFVFTKDRKAKGFDRVEDPTFAKKNNLKLDLPYYLGHKVKKPLVAFLETFDPEISKKLDIWEAQCEARMMGMKSLASIYGFEPRSSSNPAPSQDSAPVATKTRKRKKGVLTIAGASPVTPQPKKVVKKKAPAPRSRNLGTFFATQK